MLKTYTPKDVINYKEAFSLIFEKDSFKIITILVAHYDLELHQMMLKLSF